MKINPLFCTRSVEFRANDENGQDDGRTLEGYAAVFNQDTEINSWEGTFKERMVKGSFRKTIKENPNPKMQFDHGHDARTGSVPIGAYSELREDNDGLYVKGRLFENDLVEPIRQAIEGGAIDGMSFRFRVIRDEWRDNKGKLVKGDDLADLLWSPGERGPLQRTIREVQLSEAGPVVWPAYAGTSVGVRSAGGDELQRDAMTDEDRERVVASYRRTMLQEEERSDDDEAIRSWLDAETEYKRSVDEWLEAESEFTAVRSWLDAETEHLTRSWLDAEAEFQKSVSIGNDPDDAASRSTSSDPKDAVRTDTSHRETPEIPSERDKAPEKKVIAMTLAELRARLAELEVRQEELVDEYRDAEMPEAEDKEFDSNKAEIEARKASIAKIEARMADIAGAPANRQETPAFHKGGADKFRSLEEIQDESHGYGDFLKRTGEQAKFVLERAKLPVGADDKSKDSLQEMIEAGVDDSAVARRMVATGNPAYERAFAKALRAGSTNILSLEDHRALEEARAAINISGSDGTAGATGFAVPFQLDPTLVHLGAGYISPLRQLAKVVQLYGKEYQTLNISPIQVYRALEAEIATETAPTILQEALRVNKVHGWVPFSMEADEDWAGMRSEIFTLLQEAKDREEANAFLVGSGTAPQPQGLITGATTTVDTAANAGAFTLADIYALMEALPVEHEGNASFIATKQIYNKIRALGNSANANQLWGSADLSVGNSQRLLETPTYRITGMDSTTAAGKKFLVYGDVRKAFTILDRIGMEIQLVDMLFAFANPASFPASTVTQPRPTGQRGFYAHWRNNSKVVNPDAVRVLKGKA